MFHFCNGLELFQLSSFLRLIKVYLRWSYMIVFIEKLVPNRVDNFALGHCTTITRFCHQEPKKIKLWWWDKWIVDQASDVPSIILFCTFYRLRALKTLYFYFCNSIKKINWKEFCKELCKKSWKNIILGTSDTWSIIRLSHRQSDPAYYIVNWQILILHDSACCYAFTEKKYLVMRL